MTFLTSSLCHDDGKRLKRENLANRFVKRCCITMKLNSPQLEQENLRFNK